MRLQPPARCRANRGAVTQPRPHLHRVPAFGSAQQLVRIQFSGNLQSYKR
jgi:hypothetical protein